MVELCEQTMAYEIINLFPTAVLSGELSRGFTDQELAVFNELKQNVIDNLGNTTSADNYIFDRPELSQIKDECLKHAQHYIDTIYCPEKPVTPYITQSWANYTKPGQFHHEHSHPNSFLSGVLYINADASDKITFYKPGYHQIELKTENYNMYNSWTWWLPAGTGKIIMFPSSLRHSVTATENQTVRESLAFNIFLKGTIGRNRDLTELHL